MKVHKQFSRFAQKYQQYALIQRDTAADLVTLLPKKSLGNVIDIGSGEGELYRRLKKNRFEFQHFTAVDFSEKMLERHPREENLTTVQGDFDNPELFELLRNRNFDTLISSSALQWSKNLPILMHNLAQLAPFAAFSLFGSGTFATLHKTAQVKSPIPDCKTISIAFQSAFTPITIKRNSYRLYFDSPHKMLRYIKQSGVSGGELQLSFREIKQIMEHYPLPWLELETILLTGHSKCH